MSWSFTVPGQPVTTNHAYRTGKMPVKRGGRQVMNADMTPKVIHRPVLTDEGKTWRDAVQTIAQISKPSRWRPSGQLRVIIDLRLADAQDADGSLKLILDGLKRAIDYDDKHFLPCVRSMESGRPLRDACVIVTVEDA